MHCVGLNLNDAGIQIYLPFDHTTIENQKIGTESHGSMVNCRENNYLIPPAYHEDSVEFQ